MSDLLIKNMKITDRPITLVLYPNGDVDHLTQDNRYETIAKAVEVRPHGRCIDADAFFRRVQKQTIKLFGEKSKAYSYFLDILDMIKSAPTILEESE